MPYLSSPQDIVSIITQLSQAKTLWMDTETADYTSNHPRLSLIQVSADSQDKTGEFTYILDVLEQPELVDMFIDTIMENAAIEKIFHNASYDINFLGKEKVINVTCTWQMAKKVPYYILPLPNYKLKTLTEQLCHIAHVDKEEQGGDWGKRPLTSKQLEYAKFDIVYLVQVHHKLSEILNYCQPDPGTDNLLDIGTQYQDMETEWKSLDREITELKERIKAAMRTQDILEFSSFKVSSVPRVTRQVNLSTIADILYQEAAELNFLITLTKELQAKLDKIMEDPALEIETSEIWRLITVGKKQRALSKKAVYDPKTENLHALTQRYQEICPEWKLLDSEITHLKARAKNAMLVQTIYQTPHFKLSNTTTFKVNIVNLVNTIVSWGIDVDFPVTITKEMQPQLEPVMNELEIKEEETLVWRLTSKNSDNDEYAEIDF
jgi:ribonuclease D